MTKIIDNSKETLSSALKEELDEVNQIAIASAYFNVHGYAAIKEGLADKPLLFLLGREPTESIKWEEEVLRELEEEEDDARYFTLLKDAIRYFEDDKREIRVLEGPFFHGKSYIGAYPSLKQIKRGVGVVGSSNFTRGGLVNNRELNMLNTDRQVVEDLAKWFYDQWGSSTDFKVTFLSFLRNYITTHSPYEVLAKALYETYKSNIKVTDQTMQLKTLYVHQFLSVRDATSKLRKYGGVLIADSTGLGKTRTMLSLALDAIRDGRKVLLIAPKSVLETTWRDEMKSTNIFLEHVTSEKLSSDPDSVVEEYSDRDFIMVDEAHYFRTPSTNRYSAIRDLVIKNKANVVLATATPVNNSLMDLYFLLSLYLKEDCIFDLTGQTLKGYFTANQKKWLHDEPIAMEPVLERFIVRHSRELAKALDKDGKINFPERVIDEDTRDRYSTDIDYEKIDKTLARMNFAFYDLSVERLGELRLPDGTPISKAVGADRKTFLERLVKTIVIINIFKRLESSIEAFKDTIGTINDYIDLAVKYAKDKGYFVPPAMKGDPIFTLEEDLPSPEQLFSKSKYADMKSRCKLSTQEVKEFVGKCESDRKTLKELLSLVPRDDTKYSPLRDRISDVIKDFAGSNGVIIFSQYAATAQYLYERFRSADLGLPVRLATGSVCFDETGRSRDKTDVIRQFQRTGGILVSTDVLSEGQNLQNAQYVVNYDFPWNPVVLIQRVGRIDRMGSTYKYVFLVNVLPRNGNANDPSSLEYFLGLMGKLFSRLEAIRETIGLDASTLGEEAAPKDFGFQEKLAKNDRSGLDLLSRELEQFTRDPMDTLAKIMNEKGLDWLESLPNGIGAYKKSNRDGLFVLFTDGKDFHWRLQYADSKHTISSPNDIIDALLEGEISNSGESIDYESLIGQMRKMKEELKTELESRAKREKTLEGTPARPTKTVREIYDALSASGDEGEKLAAKFRNRSNQQALVVSLQRSLRAGNLLEKAKELLKDSEEENSNAEEEKAKLRRICWCWIRKTE